MPKLLKRSGNNSLTYSVVIAGPSDTALSAVDWALLPTSRIKTVLSKVYTTSTGPVGEEAAAALALDYLASEGLTASILVWENPLVAFFRMTSLGGSDWGFTLPLPGGGGDKCVVNISLPYSASE